MGVIAGLVSGPGSRTRNSVMRRYWESEADLPAPKKQVKLSVLWPLWRLYGHAVYRPAHQLINHLSHCDFVKDPDSPFGGSWVRRYPWWDSFKEWSWGSGTGKALVDLPIRHRINNFCFPLHQCWHCGDDTCLEDEEHFEVVGSGVTGTPDGTDYWVDGWRWCKRCGVRSFEHESSL